MKKFIITLLTGLFAGILVAYASSVITIPVPLAPGANYVLLSTTTGYYAAVATSSLGISGGSGSSGLSTTSPATGGFIFYATSTGQLTNSVIFESGNNIIIGTTSPATLLTVVGSTTISSLGTGSVFSTSAGGLYVVSNTGTGLNVLQTSPTLVTPILGVASGTALTLSNNLWVSGATSLQGLSFTTASGTALSLSGNLWVTGQTTLATASTTALSDSGALYITGQSVLALASTTGLTVTGNLWVTATSTLASTTITGTTNIDTTNTSYPLTVGTTTTGGQSSIYTTGGIAPRIIGYTASTSIYVNTDNLDIATTTFSYATTTIQNPLGTPHDGQMWELTGIATTSRNIAFGTAFATSTDVTTFPLALASSSLQFLFQYSVVNGNKWLILGQ